METMRDGWWQATLTAAVFALSVGCARGTPSPDTSRAAAKADTTATAKSMTPADLAKLPSQAPDQRIAYGTTRVSTGSSG